MSDKMRRSAHDKPGRKLGKRRQKSVGKAEKEPTIKDLDVRE